MLSKTSGCRPAWTSPRTPSSSAGPSSSPSPCSSACSPPAPRRWSPWGGPASVTASAPGDRPGTPPAVQWPPATRRQGRDPHLMPITVVSAEPIEGSVKREIAIVSSLGEHVVGNYVLVRVADEAGHVGLGEASVTAVWSGETQAGCIALVREVLAPLVVGADPFDSEWIARKLDRAAHGNSFARAAIELPLLALHGQILDVPVYKLLGGRDRPPVAADPGVRLQFVLGGDRGIRLKFVIGAVDPDVAAERARGLVSRGWRAIK